MTATESLPTDLSTVYTSAPYGDGAAVLRCTEHPDWEVDVDGTDLPRVIKKAQEHVTDDHKEPNR